MSRKIKILAVTACPTGIAHTYMAAEQIENTAKELGYDVKVETNGSSGVENELTKEEIKQADAILVAADTKVEMVRFNGKKLLKTSVSSAIKNPEEIIKKALEASKFHTEEQTTQTISGVGIYSHLMNGVSNMLPLVVGGGILIAISFIWGINSASEVSNEFNQIAAWISEVGGTAFGLMLPILSGYIAYSIADRKSVV